MNQGMDSTVSDQYIRWWKNMLHSVPSVAMKQLWGEENCRTEFDDMVKEKAVTKGTKIMNVLEMLKEPSVHPQLCTMLLLLLSLQLCGLSAVEYSLYPTKSLWFQLVTFLWICVTHRACLCLWSSVVSLPVFFIPLRELPAWEYKRSSSAEIPATVLLLSFSWLYLQIFCRRNSYKYRFIFFDLYSSRWAIAIQLSFHFIMKIYPLRYFLSVVHAYKVAEPSTAQANRHSPRCHFYYLPV